MANLNPHATALGLAVRGAIAQAELTQAEVAKRTGIALNTLSRRINGTIPFTWPEMVKVAEVAGVSVGELVSSAVRIADRSEGDAA